MSPVFLLALAVESSMAATVELDGARWRALQGPPAPAEELPSPQVLSRDVVMEPGPDELAFSVSWRIVATERGWFEARLTGPGVQVVDASYNGLDVAVTEDGDGVSVALELERRGTLVLRGVKTGDASRDPVRLDLLPAAIGQVQVTTEAEPVVSAHGPVVAIGDRIWSGSRGLSLQLRDPTPVAPRPDLAIATSAMGLTVGEGSFDARARVRWEVHHGELSEVRIGVKGVGSDLSVTGPSVGSWDRSGSEIVVKLLEPEDRLVELALAWSGDVPIGDEVQLPLPVLSPRGVLKTESSVQLARDGEIEIVPSLDDWTPIPFSRLPEWGRGLVTGTTTATFSAAGSPAGQVGLFRFTPVSGPPTFVDTATITAASAADGNLLMRAHYAVRNDRSPHLRITPPIGAMVVGARVAGQMANVAMDGRSWLVPLEKSVETVEGLLSFPVEVVLLLSGDRWAHREERVLPIPTVDAPVAVTRATLHLPPGYHNRLEAGEGDVVDTWLEGEGLVYGEGTGRAAEAEALMQDAVQAWMANDFEDAQGLLRELEDLGGFDENAQRLQSNLDVISGKGAGQYDVGMERRVKEQAKARSEADKKAQEEAVREAERSYLSGQYARAEAEFSRALELGEKLDKLEQAESVELEAQNMVIQKRLEKSKEEAKKSVGFANAPVAPSTIEPPTPAPIVLEGGGDESVVGGEVAGVEVAGVVMSLDGASVEVHTASEVVMTEGKRPGIRLPKVRLGAQKDATVSWMDDVSLEGEPDLGGAVAPVMPDEPDRKPLRSVTAVQLTAVIPTRGEPVRYEHLLLAAGAELSLPVDAKIPRRNR